MTQVHDTVQDVVSQWDAANEVLSHRQFRRAVLAQQTGVQLGRESVRGV